MINDIKKTILKRIKQYDTIVVARHIGPDPDAICSQVALRDAIREHYPKKKVYAVGVNISKFRKYGEMDKIDCSKLSKVLLITLDVPNMCRVDGIDKLVYQDIIKIDHHPFEEDFHGLEWIDDTSCSTCQMITELLFKSNWPISKNVASNLFLGIVSDSDRFLLSYTSIKTFKLVIKLIETTHIPFTKLYEKLYERPIEEIRFHGYLADNLKVTENGFAYLSITDEIVHKYEVDSATASNMVNDFNYIKGVYVWCFVTYDAKANIYKVNIRSKGPIIKDIASKYHGGGHNYASGVRTQNKEDIKRLYQDLDECCKEYKESIS